MIKNNNQPFPWRLFWSELIGTAMLLMVGLSLVILMFGTGSPMADIIPSVKLRQTITGFLFGGTGALIALSAVGKESGAHINPAVTMTFWLFNKIEGRVATGICSGSINRCRNRDTSLTDLGPTGKKCIIRRHDAGRRFFCAGCITR